MSIATKATLMEMILRRRERSPGPTQTLHPARQMQEEAAPPVDGEDNPL